jgi:hypothetical protein
VRRLDEMVVDTDEDEVSSVHSASLPEADRRAVRLVVLKDRQLAFGRCAPWAAHYHVELSRERRTGGL